MKLKEILTETVNPNVIDRWIEQFYDNYDKKMSNIADHEQPVVYICASSFDLDGYQGDGDDFGSCGDYYHGAIPLKFLVGIYTAINHVPVAELPYKTSVPDMFRRFNTNTREYVTSDIARCLMMLCIKVVHDITNNNNVNGPWIYSDANRARYGVCSLNKENIDNLMWTAIDNDPPELPEMDYEEQDDEDQ